MDRALNRTTDRIPSRNGIAREPDPPDPHAHVPAADARWTIAAAPAAHNSEPAASWGLRANDSVHTGRTSVSSWTRVLPCGWLCMQCNTCTAAPAPPHRRTVAPQMKPSGLGRSQKRAQLMSPKKRAQFAPSASHASDRARPLAGCCCPSCPRPGVSNDATRGARQYALLPGARPRLRQACLVFDAHVVPLGHHCHPDVSLFGRRPVAAQRATRLLRHPAGWRRRREARHCRARLSVAVAWSGPCSPAPCEHG